MVYILRAMFAEGTTILEIVELNGIPQPVFLALIAEDIFIIEAGFANMSRLVNDGKLAIFLATHGASAIVVFVGVPE